jgi:hypothetical protein
MFLWAQRVVVVVDCFLDAAGMMTRTHRHRFVASGICLFFLI